MSLPPDVREPAVCQVERYCEQRVPAEARSEIRIEHSVRGSDDEKDPAPDVRPLLAAIDEDTTAIFWG